MTGSMRRWARRHCTLIGTLAWLATLAVFVPLAWRPAAWAFAAIMSWAFVVSYHVITRGAWRSTPSGVDAMTFTAVVAAVSTHATAAALDLVPTEWLPVISTGIGVTTAFLVMRRQWIMVALNRAEKRKAK